MPKLMDITAADGGILVKIVGNPRLSSDKLKEFVPSKILATCGDGATGDCHFDCAGCPAPPGEDFFPFCLISTFSSLVCGVPKLVNRCGCRRGPHILCPLYLLQMFL